MEKSWVMTEEERLQMLKTRHEKRQKTDPDPTPSRGIPSSPSKRLHRLRASYEPDVQTIGNYLSQRDVS